MAWTSAKTWKQRPSEIYGIDEPYAAYCFDKAVMLFGMSYEADIQEAVSNAKDSAGARRAVALVQNRWFNDETSDEPAEKKFRDPAAKFG